MVERSDAGVESWLWLFLQESLSLSEEPGAFLNWNQKVVVSSKSCGPTSHETQRK